MKRTILILTLASVAMLLLPSCTYSYSQRGGPLLGGGAPGMGYYRTLKRQGIDPTPEYLERWLHDDQSNTLLLHHFKRMVLYRAEMAPRRAERQEFAALYVRFYRNLVAGKYDHLPETNLPHRGFPTLQRQDYVESSYTLVANRFMRKTRERLRPEMLWLGEELNKIHPIRYQDRPRYAWGGSQSDWPYQPGD